MLLAVLMAVMMITGTAPISPAKNKYSKTGNTWWTTKFTISHCSPRALRKQRKRGLLKSVLSAQHSFKSLDSGAALQRVAGARLSHAEPVFLGLDCGGAAALCAAARARRRRRAV